MTLSIIHPKGEPVRYKCLICGWGFTAPEQREWQRHVGECAKRNIDEIMAQAPSVKDKGGPFDPENWNPDAETHLREIGKRMLKEGRMEMKPEEKIYNE